MQIIRETDKNIRANILRNLLTELNFNSIVDFQRANNLATDGLFGVRSYTALYNFILKPKRIDTFTSYFMHEFSKRQIVLHHSAGWNNARLMFDIWQRDAQGRVATAVGIEQNGDVYVGFDERFWAFHTAAGRNIDSQSIGVELCNWGYLEKRNDKYFTYANVEIKPDMVEAVDYKGFQYFEKYTNEQIKALKYWIILNAMRFDIPLTYNEPDLWTVSQKAYQQERGIYTHNSFLSSKSDISPQKNIIEMLKNIESYEKV